MKAMQITMVIFILAFTVVCASCRKNYTCTCTYLDSTNTIRTDTTDMHGARRTVDIDCRNRAKALTQYGRTVTCSL